MKKLTPLFVALAVVGAAVLVAIKISGTRPGGAVEPSWDRETCAFCRMHLAERPFAAQLHTGDARVLFFDDPGCLFAYQDREKPEMHALYFRHVERDEWVIGDDVAFVSVPASPMGYGLGAVTRGTPGSFDIAEARRRAAHGDSDGSGDAPAH